MAYDILRIFVSTVAFESTFSIGGWVIDQVHSVLKPDIVEAIVCIRDWLFGEQGDYFLIFSPLNNLLYSTDFKLDK